MSGTRAEVDAEALLCALILSPRAFSRNRFFWLFESDERKRVRRRASRVRGILKQLLDRAEITGELELEDGRLLLRYRLENLGLSRTAALSKLEAATLRFALSKAKRNEPTAHDRDQVEAALERLSAQLGGVPELAPLA